jgi:hypothetical protein
MDVRQVNEVLRESVTELRERRGNKEVDKLYYKYFDRVQVNIMALGKIYKAIEGILASGKDVDSQMKALVKKYREN